MKNLKERVKKHWENEICGIRYGRSKDRKKFYEEIKNARYKFEPYIKDFAKFEQSDGLKVLEIGVGAGVDFSQWVFWSDKPVGIDLTEAGINHTKDMLEAIGIKNSQYSLLVADSEFIPFKNSRFDLVYSWGVLHHSPDTEKCLQEIFRVLKPEGILRIMLYHRPSWTGFMLWLRYALFTGRITLSQREVALRNLESPGTKMYTIDEAKALLNKSGFVGMHFLSKLSPGDTLSIKPSNKFQGFAYKVIWKIYPRWLVRLLGDRLGLYLLIEAKKP
ncbi:MAG: class I SAM-dependent methyltransferase [bacterium]